MTCPACAPGRVCVTTGQTDIDPPFPAACLVPCSSSADCPGQACVSIENAVPVGSYCVGPGEPGACVPKCMRTGTSITCQGDTLVRPYLGDVCGFERIHCPHGCLPPDGGGGGLVCQ